MMMMAAVALAVAVADGRDREGAGPRGTCSPGRERCATLLAGGSRMLGDAVLVAA